MNIEAIDAASRTEDISFEQEPIRFLHRTDLDDFVRSLVRVRMLRTLNRAAAHYPVFRRLQSSVARKPEEVLDDIALHCGTTAQRIDADHLLLDGNGTVVLIRGRRSASGCSLTLDIWAESPAQLAAMRSQLLSLGGQHVERRDMFTIDWHFVGGSSGLTNVSFDEAAEAPLLDEAYPALEMSVSRYIERYLDAPETVLVVIGPPGTGKTRLVRSILTRMSRRKDDSANILYTADQKAIESDEIFLDFITGSHDAFVIEDADHLLRARTSGNLDLHRFLAIADGVVRAQGRKIIFTTNLPNISDIDDALIRPGRAFGVLRTRLHTRDEASSLLRASGLDDADLPGDVRMYSLAELFRIMAARRVGVPGPASLTDYAVTANSGARQLT